MTLKQKILTDKYIRLILLTPIIYSAYNLIAFINHFSFQDIIITGGLILICIIVPAILLVISNTHVYLTSFTRTEKEITFELYKKSSVTLPFKAIKEFDFYGPKNYFFYVIKIKHIDDEGMYDTLKIKVANKEDMAQIISMLTDEKKKLESTHTN